MTATAISPDEIELDSDASHFSQSCSALETEVEKDWRKPVECKASGVTADYSDYDLVEPWVGNDNPADIHFQDAVVFSKLLEYSKSLDNKTWREQDDLFLELIESIEKLEVEECVTHPAEKELARVIRKFPIETFNWLDGFLEEAHNPSILAGIIQCLGRLPYSLVSSNSHKLLAKALNHPECEVRESAISAIENWESPSLLGLLAKHKEEVNWLDRYAKQVLRDLS